MPHTSTSRRESGADQEWQGAQERVLLYLHMLGVPGIDALEIALEALHRARRSVEGPEPRPAGAAMRALRAVLEERRKTQTVGVCRQNRFERICPWPEVSEKAGVPQDALPMPPLNRGSMKPDQL